MVSVEECVEFNWEGGGGGGGGVRFTVRIKGGGERGKRGGFHVRSQQCVCVCVCARVGSWPSSVLAST